MKIDVFFQNIFEKIEKEQARLFFIKMQTHAMHILPRQRTQILSKTND